MKMLVLAVKTAYLLFHLSFKFVDDSLFLLNSAVKARHMLSCFTWSPVSLSKPLLHHPNLDNYISTKYFDITPHSPQSKCENSVVDLKPNCYLVITITEPKTISVQKLHFTQNMYQERYFLHMQSMCGHYNPRTVQ